MQLVAENAPHGMFFQPGCHGNQSLYPGWPLIISPALGNFWEMEYQLGWNVPLRGEFVFGTLGTKAKDHFIS